MWMVATFISGLTAQVGWRGLRVGGHMAKIAMILSVFGKHFLIAALLNGIFS